MSCSPNPHFLGIQQHPIAWVDAPMDFWQGSSMRDTLPNVGHPPVSNGTSAFSRELLAKMGPTGAAVLYPSSFRPESLDGAVEI
jgi:hypothetical protein